MREHLGRFGDHPYELGDVQLALEGDVILPIGELNRMRRELAFALDAAMEFKRIENAEHWHDLLPARTAGAATQPVSLSVLVRSDEQLTAALNARIPIIYADFEDIRRYKDAVARVRQHGTESAIFVATPRIQKAGEQGFFKLIESAAPDGVLIRNLGAIDYFTASPLRKIADFSLNVANPLTAAHFASKGFERLTISYDLNIEQTLALLNGTTPELFELTLHQHMPMFHMEHCATAWA